MKRRLFWIAQAVLLCVWLAAAAVFVGLPAALEGGWFDAAICRRVGEQLDASVAFERVEMESLTLLRVRDVWVVPSGGRRVRVPELLIDLDGWFPFGGVERVTIVEPEVWLPEEIQGAGGGEFEVPSGPDVVIRRGVVRWGEDVEIEVPFVEARFEEAWEVVGLLTSGDVRVSGRGRYEGPDDYEGTVEATGSLGALIGRPWDARFRVLRLSPQEWELEGLDVKGLDPALPRLTADRVLYDPGADRITVEGARAEVDGDAYKESEEPTLVPRGLPSLEVRDAAVAFTARERQGRVEDLDIDYEPGGEGWTLTARGVLRERRPGSIEVDVAGDYEGGHGGEAVIEGDLYDTFAALAGEAPPRDRIDVGGARATLHWDADGWDVLAQMFNVDWRADPEPWPEASVLYDASSGHVEVRIDREQDVALTFDEAEERWTGTLRVGAETIEGIVAEFEPGWSATVTVPRTPLAKINWIARALTSGAVGDWGVTEGSADAVVRCGDDGTGFWLEADGALSEWVQIARGGIRVGGENGTGQFRWAGGAQSWRAQIEGVEVESEEWRLMAGDLEAKSAEEGLDVSGPTAGEWRVRWPEAGEMSIDGEGFDIVPVYATLKSWFDLPEATIAGSLGGAFDLVSTVQGWEMRRGAARGRIETADWGRARIDGFEFEYSLVSGEGWVRVEGGAIPGGTIEPSRVALEHSNGAWYSPGPVNLTLYDGRVAATEVIVQDGEIRARAEGTDLTTAAFGRWLGKENLPDGSLTGHGAFRMSLEEIEFVGLAEGPLGGGRAELTRVHLQRWSRPSLVARVTGAFEGVQLRQVTERIAGFGVVHGAVRGGVDVAIARDTMAPGMMQIELELMDGEEEARLDLAAVRSLLCVIEGPASARAAQLEDLPEELYFGRLGLGLYMSDPNNDARWWQEPMRIRGKYWQRGGVDGEYSWEELRNREVREGARELIVVGQGQEQINVINSRPRGGIQWEQFMRRIRSMGGNQNDE